MSTEHILDKIIAQTKLSKKTTDKQQKIVETAIKMFVEKGFANTSTSEIAKASGVAEGTIFRHYGTKDNLLLSVILPFLKDSIPTMAEELIQDVHPTKHEHFEDYFRALLKNRLEFLIVNKDIFHILVKELLYREDFRKELTPYFGKAISENLGYIISFYKEKGDLVDLPNPIIIRMIMTFLAGYFMSRFIVLSNDAIADEETELDFVVRFVMNGIQKV